MTSDQPFAVGGTGVAAPADVCAEAAEVTSGTSLESCESRAPRLRSTIERLEDDLPLRADERRSWLVTLAMVVLAFLVRGPGIAFPGYLVFDETYYAKDAWTLLQLGYEGSWVSGADDAIAVGDVDGWTDTPSFIVHPQLGKWLIAFGEQLFGMNSLGWRFSSLVFGCLLVAITVRMARRLSRSTLVGALAGGLLVLDGLSFMMSRIALLDIFEAFFTVAAVAAVVADRDWFRRRLAEHLRAHDLINLGGAFGPRVWFRPWRLVAGVMFGLAIGCKWNAVYVLAAMGVVSVVADHRARRVGGAGRAAWKSIYLDAPLAFVHLVPTALAVYIGTWASWLHTLGGYGRGWGAANPEALSVKLFGAPLASLWHYHVDIYNFHTGDWIAQQTHIYEAHPAGWLVLGRVIGIDAVNDIKPGTHGCTVDAGQTCLRVISGMGTPLLWWMAAIALVAGLGFWILGRDWRFAIPIVAGLVTWIMWFPNADRPLFFFYAIMIIPFTATVLAMCLGKILGPAERSARRRLGAKVAGVCVGLIALNFWFIYPILTDTLISRTAWQARMWFRSWI